MSASTSTSDLLLEMRGIGKSFPGVRALEGVHLRLKAGQVHAVVGENGAGKSTLIKILSGAYTKDEGEILFEGRHVDIRGPHDAQALGISTIYQEFNLAPDLTVAENVFLGNLPQKGLAVDWRLARERSRQLLDALGATFSVDDTVSRLSVAGQQLVEIAKALNRKTRILIMDEPSALLGDKDLKHLFTVVRSLQSRGIGIIYISHRLKEIYEIAEEVTVLKDGKYIVTSKVADISMDSLVRLMIGRDITEVYPPRTVKPGQVLLDVKGLSQPHLTRDVSFQLHAGEILGVAGMVGAGRTELARAIFGADRHSGEMKMGAKPYRPKSPSDAIGQGVALVTEDRKAQGLFLQMSVKINTTISVLKRLTRFGLILRTREIALVRKMIVELGIKTPGPDFVVANMSGGNQQKVVLARWLSAGARVFILDEPTRGIDVGSKAEIYKLMDELTQHGAGIIMISSELPEILGMSDRIMVMREGKLVTTLSRSEASEEVIMSFCSYVWA